MTLGIIASVSMKLLLLFLFFKIVVIFGVKILDSVLVKFGVNLFQSSFDDGNEIFTMDIDSKKTREHRILFKLNLF